MTGEQHIPGEGKERSCKNVQTLGFPGPNDLRKDGATGLEIVGNRGKLPVIIS
jgi:hypothetical protein